MFKIFMEVVTRLLNEFLIYVDYDLNFNDGIV